MHAINTRILAVHGFTPSQLFLGFNARIHPLDKSVVETMQKEQLTKLAEEMKVDEITVDEITQYELRLACLKELRQLTRERVIRY